MKKPFSLLMALMLLVVGCTKHSSDDSSTDGDGTTPPQPPTPEVTISVELDKSELSVIKGGSAQLVATVTPTDAVVEWSSADPKVAVVDRTGKVLGLTVGETVVSATAGNDVATCIVRVIKVSSPEVGDFYYSDGSYSSSLDADKSVVGIIFWVGDPTEEDELLRKEHPTCTNGLVVAIRDRAVDYKGAEESDDPTISGEAYHWQKNYESYNKSVGEWLAANRPEFQPITSPYNDNEVVNARRGYNNTKAIEAFNAAPENAEWKVGVVERVVEFREELPAPPSSSDWFLPSVKECSLLISGETEGDVLNVNNNINNLALINYKLSLLPDATTVGRKGVDDDIWSSNERDSEYAFYLSTMSGKVWMNWKEYGSEHHRLRCVLAF